MYIYIYIYVYIHVSVLEDAVMMCKLGASMVACVSRILACACVMLIRTRADMYACYICKYGVRGR